MATATACGGDNGDNDTGDNGGVVVVPAGTRGAQTPEAPVATPASTTPSPVATTAAGNGSALRGFAFPIAGGCLPQGDQLMPNAPRNYRQGTHEGVDFYNVDNCTPIGLGTPVLAAQAGRVVRVDSSYRDPTAAEMSVLLANPTTAEALDAFRGRQVWIDHGNGIVTRYCHLSEVAAGLEVGSTVGRGQLIAYVGESGTPESVNNPGREYHLHFEVRVGASYLGAGESPAEVRDLYVTLFGQ